MSTTQSKETRSQMNVERHRVRQQAQEGASQVASPQTRVLAALQRMANQSATVQRLQKIGQPNMAPVQRMEEEELQGKFIQRAQETKANNTGLPDALKSGVEALSGMSMDHVQVHRNSDKPATVQAHAFAQGNQIHLGPGQEKHLPHEAWHVVQQAEGRVKPTTQLKGVAVNDDPGLEAEADLMGAKALQAKNRGGAGHAARTISKKAMQLVSAVVQLAKVAGKTLSRHATERMEERGITSAEISAAITGGTKYADSDYPGATVYYDGAIAVAVQGNRITTTYECSRPKRRWTEK
ncbi:MAG: DUF4157 domain-containing protein [Roseobacter sp.]